MTWDELGAAARVLAERIHDDGYRTDMVLGTARILGYRLSSHRPRRIPRDPQGRRT